jgi:hypothetical protein
VTVLRPSHGLLAGSLLGGCVLLTACSPAPTAPTDAGGDALMVDAAPEVDAAAAQWVHTLEVPFHGTLDGETASEIQRVLLEDNLGTMTVSSGERNAFAPQTVDWTAQTGYRLVHLYSTDVDDLSVAFVYCQDDEVVAIWYESLTTRLFQVDQAGSHPCTVTDGAHDIVVEQRPFERLPEGLTTVTGVVIEGETVQLAADGTGTMTIGGLTWTLVPFGWVDCVASLCGAPGWYEVHALLRGESGETGFVILYLMRDDIENVRTGYGLRFDVLGTLPNVTLPAPWRFML